MKLKEKFKTDIKLKNVNFLVAIFALALTFIVAFYLIVFKYNFYQFTQIVGNRFDNLSSEIKIIDRDLDNLKNNVDQLNLKTEEVEEKVNIIDELVIQPSLFEYAPQEKVVYLKKEKIFEAVEPEYKVKIYTIDFSGRKNLIYSFIEKPINGKYPSVYLTKDNRIYISGIGEKGFTLFDSLGNEITNEVKYIEEKETVISNILPTPDGKKIVYTIGPAEERDVHQIYVKDLETNDIEMIADASFPRGLESIRPVGWSSEPNVFYLQKVGWEGFFYPQLWRVNIKTKSVEKIIDGEAVGIGYLVVNSGKDLAVGVVAKVDKSKGMGGEIVAPSSLKVINLKTGSSFILAQSQEFVFDKVFIAEDGKDLVFQEGRSVKLANLETRTIKNIMDLEKELLDNIFLSSDKMVIIYSELIDDVEDGVLRCGNCLGQFFIREIETRQQKLIAVDDPPEIRHLFLGIIK